MGFWLALVVSLVMTVVGELLRPKSKPPNAKASGLDDFSIPTAEEGRSVPVIAGKVKISGANVTWYGDLESVALTKKVKTGIWSSTTQTYGHRYYMGMQMVLCHGREDLQVHEIRFGDSMPKHTATNEGNGCTRFDFTDPEFYGGDEKEGGIEGVLRFYHGVDAQTANGYFAGAVGETVPAYKNITHAIFEHLYLGTSAYIKTVSFIASSYPNQLGVLDGKHKIGDDCNPACFIYEIMTDQVWGVGLQPSDIDQVQFRAVANKLYDEGYGMSLIYNGAAAAKESIADILRHIDGVMFSDPETGLVSIRLARADYVIADLPVYGKEDFLDGIKFARPSWSDTKNRVKTTYVDRSADYNVAVITQQDLANINQRSGEVSSEDMDFTGFSTYEPAALATARAIKTLSYPLARITGELDRRAWKTKPADVFVLNWPEIGAEMVVFRVTSVKYGGLNTNTVAIEACEDIFAISDVAYVQPPPSGWVDPVSPPAPLFREDAEEMPYGMEPYEGSVVGTFGSRSGGIDQGYAVVSDRTSPYTAFEQRAIINTFTPSAVLAADYPATAAAYDAVGFGVTAVRHPTQIDSSGDIEVARIVSGAGEEWIGFQGFDGATVSKITRGIFDTPPIDHPAGATIWFASSGHGVENAGPAYLADEAVHMKLLPFNIKGRLDPVDASELVVATSRRGSRPYPPGKIRIDGVHPLLAGTVVGSFVLSWAHRSRMYPTMIDQDANSVVAEEGQTYNVRVYDSADTLLVEATGATATNASIALSVTGDIRVEVEAQRNGLASRNPQTFVLAYDAAGGTEDVITVDEVEYVLDGGGP